MKSAYREISKDGQRREDCSWDWIWKWPCIQRNKTFLWLCAQNKILTNLQRKKRRFTSNARLEEESVTHALRDCPASQEVWKLLIKSTYWPNFFSRNIIDWLTFNKNNDIGKFDHLNWRVVFAEAVRSLWLRRNTLIFKNSFYAAEELYWTIIIASREFEDSIKILSMSNLCSREVNFGWVPPGDGWVK